MWQKYDYTRYVANFNINQKTFLLQNQKMINQDQGAACSRRFDKGLKNDANEECISVICVIVTCNLGFRLTNSI